MAMDQYLYIPFLGGWTSIYQLFWCSPGVPGFWPIPIWDDHRKRWSVGKLVSFRSEKMKSWSQPGGSRKFRGQDGKTTSLVVFFLRGAEKEAKDHGMGREVNHWSSDMPSNIPSEWSKRKVIINMWLKQCHKRTICQSENHFYRWDSIPSHGWLIMGYT